MSRAAASSWAVPSDDHLGSARRARRRQDDAAARLAAQFTALFDVKLVDADAVPAKRGRRVAGLRSGSRTAVETRVRARSSNVAVVLVRARVERRDPQPRARSPRETTVKRQRIAHDESDSSLRVRVPSGETGAREILRSARAPGRSVRADSSRRGRRAPQPVSRRAQRLGAPSESLSVPEAPDAIDGLSTSFDGRSSA